MNWPGVFLMAVAVVMILCCGSMLMGMKHKRPLEDEERSNELPSE